MAGLTVVPVSGQSLGASRDLIAGNFATINTAFAVNHVQYNDGTGNQGFHQFINLPSGVPVGVTNNGTAQVALYSNTGAFSAVPELFFQRNNLGANAGYSITEAQNAITGWTRLPSGIVFKWGRTSAINASDPFPYLYPVAAGIPVFNNVFTVLITDIDANSGGGAPFDHVVTIQSGTITATGFSLIYHSTPPATTIVNYLAIGN